MLLLNTRLDICIIPEVLYLFLKGMKIYPKTETTMSIKFN